MKNPTLAAESRLPPIGCLNSQSELVSNYTGTCLYPKKSWIGRLWTWFYRIHDYFFEKLEEKNLKKALLHADQLFQTRLQEATPHLLLYRRFIKKKSVNPLELAKARVALYEFYQATEGKYPQTYLPMIKVESLTRMPFPVKSNEMELFVKQLKISKVPVRLLHEAFSLIQDHARIEKILALQHPALFTETDPSHLAFRDALKEGDTILCNQRAIQLGKKLGKKKSPDRQVYFEIQGEADKLVYLGVNRALPGIRKEATHHDAWGIQPASVLEVDSEGACALVERLTTPLTSLTWTSNSPHITQRDLKQAQPLLNWLRWLKQEQFMPHDLDITFYMLDKDKVLRSTRPMAKIHYHLPALENFLKQLNNPFILDYLKSNLLSG